MSRCGQRGFGLIEIMTALAIGCLLVLAAVQIFARGRSAQSTVNTVASLQENARFALSAIARDVEEAGFFGLTNRAVHIEGRTLAGFAPSIVVTGDCGEGWTTALDAPVAGINNAYEWACSPYAGDAVAGADTLVLRHAGSAVTTPEASRAYIETTRIGAGRVFVPPAASRFAAIPTTIRELTVRGYYVSPTSSLATSGRSVPSLRVKTLSRGPRIVDEEVAPGVEDLQVELGIDVDAQGAAGFGAIDAFVTPDAVPAGAQVLAVRIWLLVRAIETENGYTATAELRYSDRAWPARDDRHRRAVFTATIFVHNAPGP